MQVTNAGTTSEYYYTADNVGSIIAVTNGAGGTAATYTYDPYGNTTATTGGTFATSTNHWRYGSGYTDTNGTIKLGARYYQPTTGRFTQPDPSGQEANRYLYAGDEPIGKSDPGGLYPCVAQSDPSEYHNPHNYDGCITDIGSTTNVIGDGLSAVGQGLNTAGTAITGCVAAMATVDSSGLGALATIIPGLGEVTNGAACAIGADASVNGARNAFN